MGQRGIVGIFLADPTATVEIRGSGHWCDDHEGLPIVEIYVNGTFADRACPTVIEQVEWHGALGSL